MSIKHYASELTDKQWHLIAPHMPTEKERGRPRATDFRMDSQSVKTASVAESSGFDGAKLIKGRKRHILVDVLGLVLGVMVHSAAIDERIGAKLLMARIAMLFPILL